MKDIEGQRERHRQTEGQRDQCKVRAKPVMTAGVPEKQTADDSSLTPSPPHRRETHEYNILMVKAIRP